MEDANPLESLLNNDPAGFRDGVTAILMDKLGDRLELERSTIASSLFGEEESEEEPDEGDGEEYEDD